MKFFNFKNEESKKNFFISTNKTEALSNVFIFINRLDGFIQDNFQKVRIEARVDHKLEELYTKRRVLQNKSDDASVEELEKFQTELVVKYSEKMYEDINNELKAVKGEDGGYKPSNERLPRKYSHH